MTFDHAKQPSFWYYLKLLHLTVLKAYLNLLDSKEATRDQIAGAFSTTTSIVFWLSISPFLWYIAKMPSLTQHFSVATNLPGIGPGAQEVRWETLLAFSDYHEKLLTSLTRVEVNLNSILLNHKTLNSSIQTLLEYDSAGEEVALKELKVREVDSTPSFFNGTDFDDIPLKLESSVGTFTKKDVTSIFRKNAELTSLVGEKPSELEVTVPMKKNLSVTKDSADQTHVKIAFSKERAKLKLFKVNTDSLLTPEAAVLPATSNSTGIQSWRNFCSASEIFVKYCRTQLFDPRLSFSAASGREMVYLRPRSMTLYQYPDLNASQVWGVTISHQIYKEQDNLTVCHYPLSSYFSSFLARFQSLEARNFTSPIYELGKLKTEQGTVFYLRHDGNAHDVAVKNRLATQTSFFNAGLRNNAETGRSVYFFGNLSKTDLEALVKDQLMRSQLLEKQSPPTAATQQWLVSQPMAFFALYDSTVKPEEIYRSYHDLANETELGLVAISDLRNRQIYFVPTTQGTQNLRSTGTTETNLLQTFGIQRKDQSLEFSPELLSFSNPVFEYSSNRYKREVGSYWRTKVAQTDEFVTLSQQITLDSLFSFSVVSYVIAIVLILKAAAADYAKEFSAYLLDLIANGQALSLDPSTIEWLNQELGLEEKKGGIRVFPKRFSKKRFTDIAGIEKLLPELSELVWFLRNKGRNLQMTPLTSKSILLIGPPGTGKTLLVQALAAEAEVPVVAQSTSVLASMNQDLTAGDAIRMAFQKARSLAPCILFFDELDSLGLRRDALLTTSAQESPGLITEQIRSLPFFEKSSSKSLELLEATQDAQGEEVTNQLRINITNEMNAKKQQEREQVAALTQLLVEIDGVQSSSGILVLGATNRSNMLDPALTRPGRFSKIISLPLPEKKKRIEVFQIHSAELGWESDIPWDYLAQRTKGFSAGDLATVANQSAIQAILNDTKHSLKTFEQAITMLTTYPSEKKTGALETTDPYYYQRDVYYKVGQAFYHYHENVEGKPAVVELTSRQPNPRHYQILANVNQDKYRLRTRLELENLLASLLSGKAGEVVMLLTLNQPASFYWESDLAKNDLYEATKLVMLMLQDWYLYSGLSHLQQQKFLTIPENQNALEYRKNEEVFSLFEETVAYVEQQLTTQFNFSFSQSFIQKAQWKADIIQEISNVDSLFAEWSRFHLPDPQETERNPEWIPPEEYYHDNETKRYLTAEEYEALQTSVDPIDPLKAPATFESLSFAELALIERDRYAHTILVNSFNKALLLLEKNREVVDTLAYYLSKNKILRSFELENLMKTGD